MFTAEFEAKVEDGKITIPEQFKRDFAQQKSVKVILVKQDDSIQAAEEDIIQQLLHRPLSVADLVPRSRDQFYDR